MAHEDDQKSSKHDDSLIKPAPLKTVAPPVEPTPRRTPRSRNWRKLAPVAGIALSCMLASFFGAWLLLATGIVQPDAARTISDNSQTIVMQQGEVIADVFKKVSPSTVAITTESVASGRSFTNVPQISEGAGSGIILSKDGYIMTNKHVVPEGTSSVTVITSDGKEYSNVKVVGRDPSNDIAFLKVDGVNDLTPAHIGDSDSVEPGQQVVAIGNALGIFRNSVTTGIISGTGRPLTASDETGSAAEQLDDIFQTDAAINPGNSGGPLLNLKGEVIGMNTAISEDGQSIGFAIPINSAKVQINSIISQGKIVKAYLGVRYVTLTPEIAEELKLPANEGAYLTPGGRDPAVVPGGPGEKAGLKPGDIITKVDGKQLVAGKGLASLLSQKMPGDKAELTVLRGDKEQKITATLGEYPQ